MKLRNQCKMGLIVAAAGVLAAGSVNAQTDLTINVDTAYQATLFLTGAPGPLGSGGEGAYLTAFQASYSGGTPLPLPTTDPFNTFCVDILPDLANGNGNQYTGQWTAGTFPPINNGAANGNTIPYVNGGIQTAASLYNTFVGNVTIDATGGGTIGGHGYNGEQWGAALQLAIWQSLYGASFSATGVDSAVAALEAAILASPADFANPNLTSTFWNATNPSDNQDLIGPQMETGFVPEPGVFMAAASGCAIFGLLVFRPQPALN
jgi:hypothetical protein